MSDDGTVRAPRRGVTALREPAFRLQVQAGPDVGKEFVLEGTQAPRVLLGTSPACDFVLTDRAVSRRHLALELSRGAVNVIDLGSTNGTTARGVSIREIILHGGETLELGATVIHVVVDSSLAKPFVSDEIQFGRYLGQSVAMRRLYPTCAKLAATAIPVLIEGESGTGKELMAEVLHELGPRAAAPFVPLDCVTLDANDAREQLAGALAEAAGGTLFLDEVSELEPSVQALVASVLDGATRAGTRILSSTRKDLDREVAEGRFREELYFRLAVARLELPPLRGRPEDVAVLARHFWTAHGGGPQGLPAALQHLDAYAWPGNVRELSNAVLRMVALGANDPFVAAAPDPAPERGGSRNDGDDVIARVIAQALPLTRARQIVTDEFERRYVHDAFIRNGSSVTKAAAAAGIARRYFRALRAKQRGAD